MKSVHFGFIPTILQSSENMYQLDGLDTPVAENMDATSIMSQSVWQFKRSVNKQTKKLRVTHRRDPPQDDFQTTA